MKRVAKRNLEPSDPSSQGNNKKSELLRTGSLSRPNLSTREEAIKRNPEISKPSGIQKAASFKTRHVASVATRSEMSRQDEIEEDGSELQQKLKLRCQKISISTPQQNTFQSVPQSTPDAKNNFNSLPPLAPIMNNGINDQDVDSCDEDTNDDGCMKVEEVLAPAPPSLPGKSKNALPLPPKKNSFIQEEEEHYAVPKRIPSPQANEDNKHKRRSLTKPQVPNKPIALRKPPLTVKPPALKMQSNPGANARNRTACKAVLHTNAANKTHLKLFQPVNDAHSRIKGR